MEAFLAEIVGQYGMAALLGAFGIGVLTSLAPCSIVTLPLLIGSAVALSGEMDAVRKRRFTLYYSLLFVAGLIVAFSLLMLAVAKAGMLLSVAPFWAYCLASAAAFAVVAYAMGWLGTFDKGRIAKKLLRFKLYGALLIGMIFGLVSTPCASAPLVAIIAVAEQSGWAYSYLLVLSFAVGHAMLLLLAGVSLGFAQRVVSSPRIGTLSSALNALFIAMVAMIGGYFAYEAYLVF